MASELVLKVSGDAREAAKTFLGLRKEVSQAADSMAADMREAGQAGKEALEQVKEEARGLRGFLENIDFGSLGLAGIGAIATQEFDSAVTAAGKLRAQLGLLPEEAREFEEIARQVYVDNFGESMGQAAEAVGMVHQALGLTGEPLRVVTEDVLRINDAFEHLGADIPMIIEDIRAMKASWPGMSEAQILDLIALGFQKGAGSAGDLQDTLQEYPPHFREIGLSAQDMLNWLNLGMEAGARNTDLLADAVKELGIRIRTEGDTGQQALQKLFPKKEAKRLIADFTAGGEAGRNAFFKILEAVSKVKDEQKRYNLLVQLFGTQGEDLVGVLDTMIPKFLQTKDATQQVKDQTALLDQQYAGFGTTLETTKRQLEAALIGPLGQVGDTALSAIQGAGDLGVALLGLKGIGVDVGGALGRLGGGFTNLGSTVMGKALPALGRVGPALLGLATGPQAPFVLAGAAAVGLGILVYRNWDKIRAWTVEKWDQVKSFLSTTWANLKASAASRFEAMKNAVVDKWESLKARARSLFQQVRDFILAPFRNLHIPVPHFEFKVRHKTIAGISVPVPDVDVRWYQTGGVFTRPIIPGFGDVDEAIVPFEGPHARRIAGLIASEMSPGMIEGLGRALAVALKEAGVVGDRTIIVNLDGDWVVQRLAPRMDSELARRQRMALRAQGVTM